MAYPTVSAPYGLKPINLIGGLPFAGATTMLPIQYGDSVSIFYGDIVKITQGFISRISVTTAQGGSGMIGVFLGCSFTNPATGQKQYQQSWPGGTLSGDAMAYVSDDPNAIYKAVVCSATTVVASGSWAMVGQNYQMINNTPANTVPGNSANALLFSATLTTATFPMRVVGVAQDTAVSQSATGSSSSTTITLTGTGLTSALVSGSDVSYIAANGQIIHTGSFTTTAKVAGDTSITINVATSALGLTATPIPAASTIIFTQFPEMLVKFNSPGFLGYQTATAV